MATIDSPKKTYIAEEFLYLRSKCHQLKHFIGSKLFDKEETWTPSLMWNMPQ
ncbi:MAG: hypothetical protein LKE40_08710 [Spirochaetia bacterium]|nr:hypothetical protein [Spirochaetia bacterium]